MVYNDDYIYTPALREYIHEYYPELTRSAVRKMKRAELLVLWKAHDDTLSGSDSEDEDEDDDDDEDLKIWFDAQKAANPPRPTLSVVVAPCPVWTPTTPPSPSPTPWMPAPSEYSAPYSPTTDVQSTDFKSVERCADGRSVDLVEMMDCIETREDAKAQINYWISLLDSSKPNWSASDDKRLRPLILEGLQFCEATADPKWNITSRQFGMLMAIVS